jgi:hypothetical protein
MLAGPRGQFRISQLIHPISHSRPANFADRLYSRGVSELNTYTTEQSRDLRVASRALRALLSEIDRVAAVTGDVAHSLHNLKINLVIIHEHLTES